MKPGQTIFKEAQFEYKCRRCDKIFRNPCCSVETARHIMCEIVMRGVGSSLNRGGYVHSTESHTCKDGGFGMADLIGAKVVAHRITDSFAPGKLLGAKH